MENALSCFKYRSRRSALKALSDGTLYFAKSDELNDILEARFDFANPAEFLSVVEQTITEVSRNKGGPSYTLDSSILPTFIHVNETENGDMFNFTKNIGIFSAANRPDNQAMWAYYAENFTGVCFELDFTKKIVEQHQLFPIDVTYSDKPRVHNRAEAWREVFLAAAAKDHDATIEQLLQKSLEETVRRKWGVLSSARATSIKHTDWEHEKEIRILAPCSGAIPIMADVLKRVHFVSTNNEDGDWGKIIELLHRKYPEVRLTQLVYHHGAITASAKPMHIKMIPINHKI